MSSLVAQGMAEARKQLGLSQEQLAERCGIAKWAVQQFESDNKLPPVELWVRLANEVGVSERTAVLSWAKSILPEEHRNVMDLLDPNLDNAIAKMTKKARPDIGGVRATDVHQAVAL